MENKIEVSREDLELLIKIVAREQRYSCVDNLYEYGRVKEAEVTGLIQNARCPDVNNIIKQWEELK